MNIPLCFVNDDRGNLQINPNVIDIIKKSHNPKLFLCYGKTRLGKSTTLNQIIKGNLNSWKFRNTSPFKAQTSSKSLTVGCDIFGPIKYSEIMRVHSIKAKIKDDYDVFFCDTEGLYSLYNQSETIIPGILTLLPTCTISVIMTSDVPDQIMLGDIASEIQFSQILQTMNPELKSPFVIIYISGFQADFQGGTDYESCTKIYEEEVLQTKKTILETMQRDYEHLNVTKNDFEVIAGGPFERNHLDEPDHTDIKALLYWDSIHNIVKAMVNRFENYNIPNYSGEKLASLMNIVFDTFKNFKKIKEIKNPNLVNVLEKYVTDLFNQNSKNELNKILLDIKNNLRNNYEKYYQILDNKKAKQALTSCIDKNLIDVFSSLIPDKINHFLENSILLVQNLIKEQIDIEYTNIRETILSDKYINDITYNLKNEINQAMFKEDINYNIINNYGIFWDNISKENEKLFLYFYAFKPQEIEVLKNNFNGIIRQRLKDLINKKKSWESFFDEKKLEILNKIINDYQKSYNDIQYQEDFYKIIEPDKLYLEIVNSYDKTFKYLSDKRKSILKQYIKDNCDKEYSKIQQNSQKLQNFENIQNNILSTVKQMVQFYIEKIFMGKTFIDDINPDLGTFNVIYQNLNIGNILFSYNLSEDKIKIINQEIITLINNASSYFFQRYKDLPSFNNALYNIQITCNTIATEKMNELSKNIKYSEDKIPFTAEQFLNLFIGDNRINLSQFQDKEQIMNKLREISKTKEDEYNNLFKAQKPSWESTKKEIELNLKKKSEALGKEYFDKKINTGEITFDLEKWNSFINSLKLLEGIEKNKQDEINEIISSVKKEIEDNIKGKVNESKKENIIRDGIKIMEEKIKSNFTNENLNQIKNILFNYAINELGKKNNFLGLNRTEINEQLQKEAETIGQKSIKQIKEKKNIIFNKYKNRNKMIMEYIKPSSTIQKNNSIFYDFKLFNQNFVNNNVNRCHFIINGKEKEMQIYHSISIQKEEADFIDYFEIILVETNAIEDMSGLFSGIDSLKSVKFEWDTSNVKNMKYMFYFCYKLTNIKCNKPWNTSKVCDMAYLFCRCGNLKELPNISIWDMSKVVSISQMFWDCGSLTSIPDLSGWRVDNLKNIDSLFYRCCSLTKLPNLFKFNSSLKKIDNLFSSCSSLLYLPGISYWNTENIESAAGLFADCKKIKELPDISNWNTNNLSNIRYMFSGCSSLIKIPDISKWRFKRNCFINMEGLFDGCSSLIQLPDILKWESKINTNFRDLFKGCKDELIPQKYKEKKIENKNQNLII